MFLYWSDILDSCIYVTRYSIRCNGNYIVTIIIIVSIIVISIVFVVIIIIIIIIINIIIIIIINIIIISVVCIVIFSPGDKSDVTLG